MTTYFSGLVYGYTGHSWFVYQTDSQLLPDFNALFATPAVGSAPAPLWHTLAQINLEMQHLGRAITQLTSESVVPP